MSYLGLVTIQAHYAFISLYYSVSEASSVALNTTKTSLRPQKGRKLHHCQKAQGFTRRFTSGFLSALHKVHYSFFRIASMATVRTVHLVGHECLSPGDPV